jgi:hypothetical protein
MQQKVFQVNSAERALEALSYFNHFHDSFIESIYVKVSPEDPGGFGFSAPVRHDVTLLLMHSNYASAGTNGGPHQRISLRLSQVMEINIGNLIPLENMLQKCIIEADKDGAIRVDVGGDGLVKFVCKALVIEEMEYPGRVELVNARSDYPEDH